MILVIIYTMAIHTHSNCGVVKNSSVYSALIGFILFFLNTFY